MSRKVSLFGLIAVLIFVVAIQGQGPVKVGPFLQASPTPQPACAADSHVYVLDPEALEDKVKELNKQGYCVRRGNLIVVGKQIVIVVDSSDLQGADDEESEE